MSESYDPMIIRHVRTFYRFDMSAFFVDYSTCSHSDKIGYYSTLWNPSRILKIKFDTLACNLKRDVGNKGLFIGLFIKLEIRLGQKMCVKEECKIPFMLQRDARE